MQDKILKRTGLRTAGKVFTIIDIVLDSLLILGSIIMFVFASLLAKELAGKTGKDVEDIKEAIRLLNLLGIISIVVAVVGLGLAIVGLRLLKFSSSFPLMLTFGILSFLLCGGFVAGILMVIVACVECTEEKTNKNKNKK